MTIPIGKVVAIAIGVILILMLVIIARGGIYNLCDGNTYSPTCPILTSERFRFMRYIACSMALCEHGVEKSTSSYNPLADKICLEYKGDKCDLKCSDLPRSPGGLDDLKLIERGYNDSNAKTPTVLHRPENKDDSWFTFIGGDHYCGNSESDPNGNYIEVQLDSPVTLGSGELQGYMKNPQIVADTVKLTDLSWKTPLGRLCPHQLWESGDAIMAGELGLGKLICPDNTVLNCFTGKHLDLGETPFVSYSSQVNTPYPSAVYVKDSYAKDLCDLGGSKKCVTSSILLTCQSYYGSFGGTLGPILMSLCYSGLLPMPSSGSCATTDKYQSSCSFKSTKINTAEKITYKMWGVNPGSSYYLGCGYSVVDTSITTSGGGVEPGIVLPGKCSVSFTLPSTVPSPDQITITATAPGYPDVSTMVKVTGSAKSLSVAPMSCNACLLSTIPTSGSTVITASTSDSSKDITISLASTTGKFFNLNDNSEVSSCKTGVYGSCQVGFRSDSEGTSTITATAPSYSSASTIVKVTNSKPFLAISASPPATGTSGSSTISALTSDGKSGVKVTFSSGGVGSIGPECTTS